MRNQTKIQKESEAPLYIRERTTYMYQSRSKPMQMAEREHLGIRVTFCQKLKMDRIRRANKNLTKTILA